MKEDNIVKRRPAEVGSGLILVGTTYAAVAAVAPNGVAIACAIAVGVVPLIISRIVDSLRS
jgi:hypothetical protein